MCPTLIQLVLEILSNGYAVHSNWMQGGKNAENSRRKIFIGGLPASVTENQLKEYFSRYGHVCSYRFSVVIEFNDFILKHAHTVKLVTQAGCPIEARPIIQARYAIEAECHFRRYYRRQSTVLTK